MALAANANRTYRGEARQAFQAVNAIELYAGAIAAINSRGHGTVASRGRAPPMTDRNIVHPVRRALSRPTGAPAAAPIVEASIHTGGGIIQSVSVATSASVADHLRLVYMTDDDTFTLARPAAAAIPVGFIVRWITGTTCDVQIFSLTEFVMNAMAGQGQALLNLGTVCPVLAAAGNLATGIRAPHHGFITEVFAICKRKPTDADVHMDIQLEIGGTNLTGGIVTLDFGDAVADKKAGTAVTGTNEVHDGDLIDIEALAAGFVAGTATDVGQYDVYAVVQPEPGA